jgi:DNA-binding response OmpR family regulator
VTKSVHTKNCARFLGLLIKARKEDDPDTRDLVHLLLKLEGFEVVYADSAEQALSLASTNHFDLYLLDNWVRGLGGEDLCRKLREFDQTTPILFYSGAGHESDKAGALAAGAQGYVVKPADPDELASQIHALIK